MLSTHTVFAKIAALGFIILILTGNFWISGKVFNGTPWPGLIDIAQVGVVCVFLGAVGLIGEKVLAFAREHRS